MNELFGQSDETTFVNPPFYCDYGSNIFVGKNCFINYNCTMLDNARITMGDNCLLAPNVSIYTAGHTLYPDLRSMGYEYGVAVTIGAAASPAAEQAEASASGRPRRAC